MAETLTPTDIQSTLEDAVLSGGSALDLSRFGISKNELTPSVSLVMSALLERVQDLGREHRHTKERLSELESLVDVDCLVPIPNRRAFMRRLNWAISMHDRYGHPSSILFVDLNNLKQVNDGYGHAAGDAAIKHVAELLVKHFRESDFIARLGGDEFGIILYYADEEEAQQKGHFLARTIMQESLVWGAATLSLSVAVGAHSIRRGETAEAALAAADMAMYMDKKRMKAQFSEALPIS